LLRAAAWVPVSVALGCVAAGDKGVSLSVYSGRGSTAFPCRLAFCLRDVDIVMGAAYWQQEWRGDLEALCLEVARLGRAASPILTERYK